MKDKKANVGVQADIYLSHDFTWHRKSIFEIDINIDNCKNNFF